MSKNLTRKGLAFGALVALASSVIAGAPASAAGIETDLITIKPTSGPATALAITAGIGQTFSFTATPSTSVTAGGTIKTLVTDLSGKFLPTAGSTGVTATADLDATATVTANATTDVVTITQAAATGFEDDLTALGAQVISLPGALVASAVTLASADKLFNVTLGTDTVSFTSDLDITDDMVADLTAGAGTATAVANAISFVGKAANGSFVISSEQTAAGSAPVVELKQLDALTRKVTLENWVDAFFGATHTIDSNEYKSKPVEATFIKASEVVWSTALTAPLVGDATLNATITSSPTLNGLENGAATLKVRGQFTRQDSSTKAISAADITQDVDTAEWKTSITTLLATTVDYLNADGTLHGAAAWADLAAAANGALAVTGVPTLASKVVTVTTAAATHNLRVGETVAIAGATAGIVNGDVVVTSVPAANKFTYALDAVDATVTGTVTYRKKNYSTLDLAYIDRVVPGDYSAQAIVSVNNGTNFATAGSASKAGTQAVAAKSTKITTAGTATVAGSSVTSNSATEVKVKSGALTVPVVVTALDVDGVALGAGRSVTIAPSARTATVKVNGKTGSQVLTTDAAGQVSFDVTDTAGSADTTVTLTATPEGVTAAAASIKLLWVAQDFGLVDFGSANSGLETTRTILAGGSYDLQLAVLDQFFQAPTAGDYQLVVSGSGVTEAIVALTAGKATVKVVDNKVNTDSFTTTVKLQKKGTTGVFATASTTTFTTNIAPSAALVTGAKGSTLYGNAVVLSSPVAAKALLELDKRSAAAVTPAYANKAVINGKVSNASSATAHRGAAVTLTGASSMLFETTDGNVAKKGSITVLADTNGKFEVNIYSTTAQVDTVVTVASLGKSVDVKVSFTGVSTSVKKLSVTPNAATYIPGQTVLYTIKLTDDLGNPVNTVKPADTLAAAYITVTYAGPGIISQTLPVETDAAGEAQVRIVTGVVDTQAAVLTVKYDQNFDGDFVDTYDLTATSTVYAVGTAPSSSVAAASGSTGKFYVSATNAANRTVVVKVAGKFVKSFVPGSASKKVVAIVASAGNKAVTVFVGGKLALTKTVTVK